MFRESPHTRPECQKAFRDENILLKAIAVQFDRGSDETLFEKKTLEALKYGVLPPLYKKLRYDPHSWGYLGYCYKAIELGLISISKTERDITRAKYVPKDIQSYIREHYTYLYGASAIRRRRLLKLREISRNLGIDEDPGVKGLSVLDSNGIPLPK